MFNGGNLSMLTQSALLLLLSFLEIFYLDTPMMFTPSSHFVSKLFSVFFISSCNGRNNDNHITKHTVVNTKQKSLSFFSANTEMKALRLTQTTVGLIGQVPCH